MVECLGMGDFRFQVEDVVSYPQDFSARAVRAIMVCSEPAMAQYFS